MPSAFYIPDEKGVWLIHCGDRTHVAKAFDEEKAVQIVKRVMELADTRQGRIRMGPDMWWMKLPYGTKHASYPSYSIPLLYPNRVCECDHSLPPNSIVVDA